MRRLLLVSNSTQHGGGYLDHCADRVSEFLDGVERLLFVPYALYDRDAYAGIARERFERLGIDCASIHEAEDPVAAVRETDAVFIGGGNTFRLLATLYREGVMEPIRRRVADGMPYMGTSAGSNVACATIRTTNDMPIVEVPSFDALGLVPFQINPHYLDPDPDSKHKGETREERLEQFLEENDRVVVGLREGSMLHVEGDSMQLLGSTPARVFRRDSAPREVSPGEHLDSLLRT